MQFEKFEKEQSVPSFPVSQLTEVCRREGISGLIFSSTTVGRADLILQALELQELDWLVTEKPFASSLKEATQICAKAEESGKRVGVNHQMRFMPQYILIRDMVVSGEFGLLVSMDVSAQKLLNDHVGGRRRRQKSGDGFLRNDIRPGPRNTDCGCRPCH